MRRKITRGFYSNIPTIVIWCVGIIIILIIIISIGIVIVVTIIVVVVVVIFVVILLTTWSGLGSWLRVRISLD